jgi:hypothetical protein
LVYSVPRPGGNRTLRKHFIGTRGVMPLHEARERALGLRLRVERGEDPAAERKAEREAETFKQLAERRLAADDLGESGRGNSMRVALKRPSKLSAATPQAR